MNRHAPPLPVPFGTSRTKVTGSYALIAPDSHVPAPAVGWTDTTSIVMISPRMGADFCMYLVTGEAGSKTRGAAPGVERFAYVESGAVRGAVASEEAELSGPL